MTEFVLERTPQQKVCFEIWWLVLFRGTAALLLGILLLIRTRATLLLLVQVLGAFFIIDGTFTLLLSLRGMKYFQRWGTGVFVAVLSILAGVIALGHPAAAALLTMNVLVYFLAFTAMLWGLLGILTGARLHRDAGGERSMVLGGLLAVGLGGLLMIHPRVTFAVLILSTASFAVVLGGFLVVLAFSLRKICRS